MSYCCCVRKSFVWWNCPRKGNVFVTEVSQTVLLHQKMNTKQYFRPFWQQISYNIAVNGTVAKVGRIQHASHLQLLSNVTSQTSSSMSEFAVTLTFTTRTDIFNITTLTERVTSSNTVCNPSSYDVHLQHYRPFQDVRHMLKYSQARQLIILNQYQLLLCCCVAVPDLWPVVWRG